jgi:DNA polymerase I-like protein with 3'-5' exonuclease and polymerase domains
LDASLEYKLPNVRKLFIPDKGYAIFDCDLSGADAQVVAWDCNDEDLKNAFRGGLKIHVKNCEDMYGQPFDPARDKVPQPGKIYSAYDEMKRFVHATNYGSSARTLAITLGWKTAQAELFQSKWFKLHPRIKHRQREIETQLQTTRRVSNAFGYRITYFDRIEGLLPQALAWIPQSTIGIVCSRGGVSLRKNTPWAEPLLQVHDSLVFQLPYHRINPAGLEAIKRALYNEVPYPDPLLIPWGISASGKSWGDCQEISWAGEGINEVLR